MGFHGTYSTKLGKNNLHLDLFPFSGAAYSLRKLRRLYLGNCIKVRRSSDNLETDIGFVNDRVDLVKLHSFIGASSGFVTTWYDQTSNGRNATQTTTSNQPRIINSGVLDSINNFPAIQFDSHLLNITWTGFSSLNLIASLNIFAPALASAADTATHNLWGWAGGGGGTGASNRGISYFTSTSVLSGETMNMSFSNASVNGRLGKTTNYTNRANELLSLFTVNSSGGSTTEKNRSVNTQSSWQLASGITASSNTAPSNAGTSSTALYIKSVAGATNTVSQKYLECIFYTEDTALNYIKQEAANYYRL